LFILSLLLRAKEKELNQEREKTLFHSNAFGIATDRLRGYMCFCLNRQKSFSAAKTTPRA
jgi:hypothetical protein